MKVTATPLRDVQVERDVVALLHSGTELECVVRVMRERGLSKIGSMTMLRDHAGMRMGDAKRLVHLSAVWADRMEADDAFHEATERAAREAGFAETSADAEKRPA